VDGEADADRLRQEGAPVEPGARGQRHPRLDRREALAFAADAAHAVWRSGDTAIIWRRALATSAGDCWRFQLWLAVPSAACANCVSAVRVAALSAGLPQKASAFATRPSGVDGRSFGTASVESAVGLSAYCAAIQRPRKVAVSSQRVSSQPATLG